MKTTPINPTLKYATLEAHGNVFKLVFTFNSLCVAESLSNQNLLKSLDMTNMSMSSIRALLYATLLPLQPKTTLDQAGDILQRVGVPACVQAVISAWHLSQPDDLPNEPTDESEVESAT